MTSLLKIDAADSSDVFKPFTKKIPHITHVSLYQTFVSKVVSKQQKYLLLNTL